MCLPECEEVGDKMDTCMCMVDSLCCTPETITTLLISYTQYKMFLVFKKKTNIFVFKKKEKWVKESVFTKTHFQVQKAELNGQHHSKPQGVLILGLCL